MVCKLLWFQINQEKTFNKFPGLEKISTTLKDIFKTYANAGSKSPCTPKALSLGVERHILGLKITTLFIHMWHAHCKQLDAELMKHCAALEPVLIYCFMHIGGHFARGQSRRFQCAESIRLIKLFKADSTHGRIYALDVDACLISVWIVGFEWTCQTASLTGIWLTKRKR